MLTIQNLFVSYTKEYDALHDINLSFNNGDKKVILGNKESGKTTLLRTIAKLENITSGDILIDGVSVKNLNYSQDVSIGYVPKIPVFKNKKTVFENLKYILKARRYDQASINFKIISALKTYGIDSLKNVPIESLSYYQKIMVQIARVSMRKIDIFLIDNITKDMSKDEREKVIEALKILLTDYEDSIFLITTDDEKLAKELNLDCIKLKLGAIEE